MRLSYDQLNLIKEKMGVSQLWSFSKVGAFDQCSWLYKLKYVDKIRVKGDSCYTWWGSTAHDIIQEYYEGINSYKGMSDKLEAKVIEYLTKDDPKLKFPKESEWDNYIANLRHYFSNVKIIEREVLNEKPVLVVLDGKEKYVFQGYMDSEYTDDDGHFYIVDYKTSSMSGFTGQKLLEKARQLILYAVGVNQFRKIPLENIRLRYDMMKYCNISFMQKNGKIKVTKAERRLWVAHLANQLRKDLEDIPKDIEKVDKEIAKLAKKMNMKKTTPEEAEGYSVAIEGLEVVKANLVEHTYNQIEVNELIEEAINQNNLDNMPPMVRDKYTVENCHIDIELTEEVVEQFKADMVAMLDNIVEKSGDENLEEAFTRERIDQGDSYYCVNLCDMKDHCKYYAEYKEHQGMFIDKKDTPSDSELLAMLGL